VVSPAQWHTCAVASRTRPTPRDLGVASRMRKQRTKGTGPELALMEVLRRRGFRVESHPASLPGKPDLVLRSRKLAVFVHGCFWHGCAKHFQKPIHNGDWWVQKISETRRRDRRKSRQLRKNGWSVVIVWEHASLDAAANRIQRIARARSAISTKE